MTEQAASKILSKEAKKWIELLWINDWSIRLGFERLGDKDSNRAAITRMLVDYNKATVHFDLEKNEDPALFLEHIHHELIHILLAKFSVLHSMIEEHVKDEGTRDLLLSISTHASEQTVERIRVILERLLKEQVSVSKPRSRAATRKRTAHDSPRTHEASTARRRKHPSAGHAKGSTRAANRSRRARG